MMGILLHGSIRNACIYTGIFVSGVNTILPSIWGVEAGPYMQLLYLSYTIGGFMSPLVFTEPFMAPKEIHIASDHYNDTSGLNLTDPIINGNLTNPDDIEKPFETEIEYAFIITTALCALSCVPYAVMSYIGDFDLKAGKEQNVLVKQTSICESQSDDCIEVGDSAELHNDVTTELKHDIEEADDNEADEVNDLERRDKMSGYPLIIVLLCVAMVNGLYSAAEQSLGDYIVTFCLDYLNWENREAATINSLYWLVSFLGGIGGVILVQVLSSGRLVLLAHVCWLIAFIGATFATVYYIDILIWICVPISGFFMVQIIPASISWTGESVCKVTGKVMSLIMIATGMGLASNPPFVAYIMQIFSYASFMYIIMVDAAACFSFFLIGYTITYMCSK